MEYKFSVENKMRTIAFLRSYIELCLKHKTIVIGIIGAGTAIWNTYKYGEDRHDTKDELRSNIHEIISNLYDDSGNLEISGEDEVYIGNKVKDLLEEDK